MRWVPTEMLLQLVSGLAVTGTGEGGFVAEPPLDFQFFVERPIHMTDHRVRSRRQTRATPFAAVVPAQRSACTAPRYNSTPWCGPACRRYRSWHSAASRRAIIHSLRARLPSGPRMVLECHADPLAIRWHANRASRLRLCPRQTRKLMCLTYFGPRPDKG